MLKFFQRFYRTDYMIAYRFINDNGILNNNSIKFTAFKNNINYWYADPILYKLNGKIYMFYEAYNKKKNSGEIGVATIINNRIVDKQIVINEPFHMSYPFVFDIKNKIYMIPETSSNNRLLLYESVDFPNEWKLSKVLMDNIELSDATTLKLQDKIYIFVSKLLCTSPYKDELLIYSLDNEFNLIPHKRNPIITDNEFTRPAGRILEYNKKLIRVSQDCSNGEYGKAIKFNEIISISDHSYQENNISTILPDDIPLIFHKKLTGTHTYGRCDNFEVIDVRYSVFDVKKLLTFLYKLPYKFIKKSITIAIKSSG
ncbi:glucosamine inositolphosphorylceramide transferase family protein [Neobacillus drentensis]|uniref:glucosamine inositolphosphorylceramide transferase family protein n=1 Tax=Neobacillus drentensis TaxID=220684 RepID=UPI002FFEBF7F